MFAFAFSVSETIPVQIVFLAFLLVNRDKLTDLFPSRCHIFSMEQLIYFTDFIIWCI